MVTYGGMSREPVIAPTTSFIFKDIQLRGFWMSRWHTENGISKQCDQMYDDLLQLMKDGKLIAPAHKSVPLHLFQETLKTINSSKSYTSFKYFLNLQD